jgi:hypothetical protein
MHLRTAWNDYFTGSPTQMQQKEYGATKTLSATSVHVSNCLFRSITSGSNGGALSCSTSVTYLLVESSSFFTCKTSKNGGAIYFYNTDSGECVLYEVCGYNCSSTNGQFSEINVKNAASNKNYVNYSSIARCVNENSNTWYTLCNRYGKNCYPSVNLSMNKCYSRSGIFCYPLRYSNFVACSLSYSSFADNIATGFTCFLLNTEGEKCEIKSCNIIRNTQGSLGNEGTVYINGNMIINDSCILENRANYIFYAGSSSYTITLSSCTVDSTSSNGNINIQSTVTKSFILALNHMSTQNCHSEYDSAETLTPIIPPQSTFKKQIHCYTFQKIFVQVPHFISLTDLFIFNFIHPYASIDPFY